ncbi:hypothetical protein [Amycolatopsis sp.]|jgi:hypothetical protein|uniref:hypothetical protein n=1 Tax=Amycolatopsis sp. TaxID=37632 RepID=UPI002DFB7A28|nr:hypothetical protein [Amycolatopsis sp.]
MQSILSARRVRRHRIPVVLAVLAMALTGCTTTMSGSAGPGRIDEKLGLPGNRGIVLRQQLGTGTPHTFGGVPAYDACTVMSLDVVQQSGYEVNSTPSRGPVLRTTRMTEDAPDDPNGRGDTAAHGVSECLYPGPNSELLVLTIYQAPFDAPQQQDSMERSLRRQGGVDGEVAGFRTLTAGPSESSRFTRVTAIFPPGFYVEVLRLATRAEPTDEAQLAAVVKQVAERLHAPPTGPSTYSYGAQYSHVRPPCEVFTSADFRAALGFGTDGRVVEEYELAQTRTDPSPDSGNLGHTTSWAVETSCKQETQSAANSGVGTSIDQGITLRFTNYLTEAMAVQANDYDCALGKGFRRPFGEPKTVPFAVGDGLTCLSNMGKSVQSPLEFKSGRTTVEMSVWSVGNLGGGDAAVRIYSGVGKAVAARLTGG